MKDNDRPIARRFQTHGPTPCDCIQVALNSAPVFSVSVRRHSYGSPLLHLVAFLSIESSPLRRWPLLLAADHPGSVGGRGHVQAARQPCPSRRITPSPDLLFPLLHAANSSFRQGSY